MTAPDDKRMSLRYPGICRLCGSPLAARTTAIYEPSLKTVRCVECPNALASTGIAGASARREYERRKSKDEQRLRQNWGRLGGLAVALSTEKQSTKAWATGAVGEERIGARLDSIAGESIAVLHDRRLPGTRANIDHLVVTTGGVWVIDAKRYKGRPALKIEGGFIRPRVEKLAVGRRDARPLVDGALKQVERVQAVVGDLRVSGVLCFVNADWPLVGGSFLVRGIEVTPPRRLLRRLRDDSGGAVDVAAVTHRLALAFPLACG